MRAKARDAHLTQVAIIVLEIFWIWFFQEKEGEDDSGIWFRRVLFSIFYLSHTVYFKTRVGTWDSVLELNPILTRLTLSFLLLFLSKCFFI